MNLVHFSLKIWCLEAPILLIFLRIDWPQCRINEHTGQLLVGPNALWPTQPKFWKGHGPPGPRCSAPPCRVAGLPCDKWHSTALRSLRWSFIKSSTLFSLTIQLNYSLYLPFSQLTAQCRRRELRATDTNGRRRRRTVRLTWMRRV